MKEATSNIGRHGRCETCDTAIQRSETGRRKRFCSDRCRRAVGGIDLNRLATVPPAETQKYAIDFNGGENPKTQPCTSIVAPWKAIEAELGQWRDWERIESTDGVVSYTAYVGKDVVGKCGFGKLAVFRDLGLLYRDDTVSA